MNELLVETYLETQETPNSKEDIDQYNSTLIDLGLEHLAIKENERPISPMSDLEKAVYETLCPKTTKLDDYKHPIPIRVLKAFQKCKPYLEDVRGTDKLTIEIWEDKDPDPIMIAKIGYGHEKYLIGRWGKELQDFPTLLKRAKEIVLSNSIKKIEEARAVVKMFDNNPDSFATGKLSGNISSIYF